MKHPALTRVFSIILSIFGVILLFAAAVGMAKNISDAKENRRQIKLLKDNLAIYEELKEKIDGKPSYDVSYKEYEDKLQQHEERKAQQKTDLALHSATLGGIEEGKEQLLNASGQLIAAQKQAYDGIAQIDSGISQAQDGITQAQAGLAMADNLPSPMKENIIQQCNDGINLANATIAGLESTKQMIYSGVGQGLDALLDASYMLNQEVKKQEEEGQRLESEKIELENEKRTLDGQKKELDELKLDEKKLTSAKVKMMRNDSVRQLVDNGDDIIEVAKNEINRKSLADTIDFILRVVISLLAVAAAALAFYSVPVAFENSKDLNRLYFSVIGFTLFTVIADIINMCIGRGQSYSALLAAIFGIIQCIVIWPDEGIERFNRIKNKIEKLRS